MFNKVFYILFFLNSLSFAMAPKLDWGKATERAIAKYGVPIEPYITNIFEKAHAHFPPQEIALLAFKQEQVMELWAKNDKMPWQKVKSYPLTARSGRLGPKLKENDLQIPEGTYHLTEFNPFSRWHLSIKIDYPNHFDSTHALQDGRKNLGYDIFIHGKSASAGCLAIGDKAINELFLITYRVGLNHTKLIIAPNDLRYESPATTGFAQPRWLPELYKNIKKELRTFSTFHLTKRYSKPS